jgi:ribosomal-protein-alanine N-acetyltransferase
MTLWKPPTPKGVFAITFQGGHNLIFEGSSIFVISGFLIAKPDCMKFFSETERLAIRPLHSDDTLFVFQLLNTDGWLRYIGDRNVRNVQDASNYIQRILAKPDYFFHVFSLKQNHTPLGIITYLKRPELPDFDLGFALLPQFENHGFAFEAAQEIVSKIKATGKKDYLYAITLPDNEKSIKLLQKLGMSQNEYLIENSIKLAVFRKLLNE